MKNSNTTISVSGKIISVPCIEIEGRTVVSHGKFLKIATIRGEDWLREEPVSNPVRFISELRQSSISADLFVFSQSPSHPIPRHPQFHFEIDNAAAINLTTYEEWLKNLSQDTRRNVRLSEKRGVRVAVVPYDDELVKGIKQIYDETPIRQGRKFWHYGKPLEAVKKENGTYLDRSVIIAAYHGKELIGFIKMVEVGESYSIMQILSKNQHFDKRPAQALIAKAVEVACQNSMKRLLYCKYVYGKRHDSSITEFKRRLQFRQIDYPRYYIPLTWKGSIALRLRLHRSMQDILPPGLSCRLLRIREWCYQSLLHGNPTRNPI